MENKCWLSPREVEKEFGVSYSTLARHRLRKNNGGSLPFYYLFGRVRYKRSDILEWIEKTKTGSEVKKTD